MSVAAPPTIEASLDTLALAREVNHGAAKCTRQTCRHLDSGFDRGPGTGRESPEHHERGARLYAEAKGWDVVEVYRLDAMSGKTVKDYPETKRMLDHISSGRITGLIFSKLARLARNTRELLEFVEIFRQCDADLISLAESIDTSTRAGPSSTP